ncbi:Methyltransferase grgD [Dirofilaria immitis]
MDFVLMTTCFEEKMKLCGPEDGFFSKFLTYEWRILTSLPKRIPYLWGKWSRHYCSSGGRKGSLFRQLLLKMDCSSICLLALSLALPQPHNIQKCEYCMDIRLLAEQCFNNLSSCMNNTSHSVLYCLTIHEVSWTSQVNRLVRCLSHSDFSLTLENAEKLLHEGSCSHRAMLSCDCSTCKSPSPKLFQTEELESQRDVAIQPSASSRIMKTNSMSVNFDYKPAKQSEAKAEKEELIERLKNQMTEKPEIKTANNNRCSITYIPLSIILYLVLLHFCQ